MTIGIFHNQLPHVPFPVIWGRYCFSAFCFDAFIIFINIINHDKKPGSGIALAFFRKKYFYVTFTNSAKCRWIIPFPFFSKTQFVRVESNAFRYVLLSKVWVLIFQISCIWCRFYFTW